MKTLQAHQLIENMLPDAQPAEEEKNLFLSCFTVKGENDWIKGQVDNIFIRPNFTLNCTDIAIKQTVKLCTPFPAHLVGFTFCLQGKSTFHIPQEPQPLQFTEGTSTLYKTSPHTGEAVFYADQQYKSIAIHLEAQEFQRLLGDKMKDLPMELQQAFSEPEGHQLYTKPFDNQLLALLHQLANMDSVGIAKQLFVEAKVLEIMGLMIDQLKTPIHPVDLKQRDIEKIKACESYLIQNYNKPLSILQLAKETGLNEFKLKQGFKAVFGKPTFKYLQEYRLNKAKELLLDNQLSVAEVSESIGYTSVGSFSNAFLGQFGYRPNHLKSL